MKHNYDENAENNALNANRRQNLTRKASAGGGMRECQRYAS